MKLTSEELKRLAVPLAIAVALLGAGLFLAQWAGDSLAAARRSLAVAQNERRESTERLARIAEEEREVNQKLDVYQRLRGLHILGEERRLEWADAISRIRKERELLDLRYRVQRQKLLYSAAGKPANVDFYGSTMRVDLALLHEEDLLRFLSDLRRSGNAYYSIQRCSMARISQAPSGTNIAARLSANCEIELITIVDWAARP